MKDENSFFFIYEKELISYWTLFFKNSAINNLLFILKEKFL